MLELREVNSPEELGTLKTLFEEYATSLNYNICFQSFSQELKRLPGEYAPPEGNLIIAYYSGEPAGCAALKKLSGNICEIKRLYVKNQFRGLHIGRLLTERIISEAKSKGYEKIRLDTISEIMKTAQKLYESLGFKDIKAYSGDPVEGVRYMELTL